MIADGTLLVKLFKQINETLNERDGLFPKRDLENTKRVNALRERYLSELEKQTYNSWFPDEAVVQETDFGQNVLFICGYIKSGTTLFLSLLDNHPELIVLPGDSHLVHLLEHFSCEERNAWIRRWVWHFVCPTGQKPFWVLGGEEQYIEFWQYLSFWLEQLCPQGDAGLLTTVSYAYFCANPKRPSTPKLWVEKTPRNERDIPKIRELFPNARFIHMIRDPFQNIVSLKKLNNFRGWHWRMVRTVFSLWRSLILGLRHRYRLGVEQYLFISYEALVTNSDKTMRQVAEFLDIKWNTSMLTSTVNGLPMKANSMFKDRQVTGVINSKLTNDWRSELSWYEKVVAVIFLYPLKWVQRWVI